MSKSKLRFGKVTGQSRLSQKDELEIESGGVKIIETELGHILDFMISKPYSEVIGIVDILRANSLIWVYFELEGKRIVLNIRIAATRVGLMTINQIADKAQMNASFLGKILNLEPGGGWNLNQVFRITAAIELDPRVILFSDLAKIIKEEEKKYKEV